MSDAAPDDPILLETAPNVSTAEPRAVRELAATLARAPEVRLLQVSSSRAHGRTVFTALGEQQALVEALVALARRTVELLDFREHEGLHPCVGLLDVVPLSSLRPERPAAALAECAQGLARRLADEVGLTCVAFDAADPAGRSLLELRRGGSARLFRRIDAGEIEAFAPARPEAAARLRQGLTCVGAREPLVSLRVELATGELRLARRIAGLMRESTGGLPAVRALPLKLGRDRVQLCLSLADPAVTSVERAYDWIERMAAEEGVAILRSELAGCVRRSAWPAGTGALVRDPELDGEGETRRIFESWLPGGSLAEDEGLSPADLPGEPEAAEEPATPDGAAEPPPLRLLDLPLDAARQALADLLVELGDRPYRAGQVLGAIWQRRQRDFGEMKELPAPLRRGLAARVQLPLVQLAERRASSDGTVKYLWRLLDGAEVESVSIPTARRTTFCLSSQVGCSLKCVFCATGRLGFGRNLSAGEIVDQALAMLADQQLSGESLNVVFMGQGEPGHNLGAVLPAIRALNDPAGLSVGARRITFSTSGVSPAIRELAAGDFPCRLAVSLHAANQELRESLMNIAAKHPLPELLDACRAYQATTRHRITFEYCVIPGLNDGPRQARELATLARSLPSKINLIPYNPVPEYRAEAAPAAGVKRFRDELAALFGGEVMVRETRGRDIEAACGMLHRSRQTAGESPVETPGAAAADEA